MKKKIKTWLIHLLDGDTREETVEINRNSYDIGVYTTLINLMTFAQRQNGKTADEWCRAVYGYIEDSIKKVEKR